jgi:hypothetical protein
LTLIGLTLVEEKAEIALPFNRESLPQAKFHFIMHEGSGETAPFS